MAGLCDFHIHSCYSDGTLSISQIVDIYGSRGFKAICLTDHLCEQKTFLGKSAKVLNKTLTRQSFDNYIFEIKKEAARAWRNYKMHLIPGFEITKNSFSHKNSAHILAINISEFIDPDLSIEKIVEIIKSKGGLSIAAHPVETGNFEHQTLYLWKNREKYKKIFDGWEVATGRRYFKEVKDSGLPIIANSDLHHKFQIESWKTFIPQTVSTQSVVDCIKNQKLDVVYYKDKSITTGVIQDFVKIAP